MSIVASAGSQSFDNDFARNVIIFGVDNSSSHADNCKKILLILDEGPTFGVNRISFTIKKN